MVDAPYDIPLPVDLGFNPVLFPSWREWQYPAIMDAVNCPTRFSGHCAGTGYGKGLIYMGYARATELRTLVLTPWKGLQDDLASKFSFVSDIRGKSNYWCPALGTDCDRGSPRCDVRNSILSSNLCGHKADIAKAQQANIVVTNYACWLHQIYGGGFGKFDALVLDEADSAEGALSEFLAFELTGHEVIRDLNFSRSPKWTDPIFRWKEWARGIRAQLEIVVETYGQDAKKSNNPAVLDKFFDYRNILRKVTVLCALDPEAWVSEETRNGVQFDPIWPGDFAESYLFRGIPRVMFYSATLNRKTFGVLNVKEQDYVFYDYPAVFHPGRNPLYLIPVGDMSAASLKKDPGIIGRMVQACDQVTEARLDRNGIAHTVSFEHLGQYVDGSNFGPKGHDIIMSNRVFHHDGRRTSDMVDRFKEAPPPVVGASPSLGAGWDFPHGQCRYQMIFKVPYPDATSKVQKARRKRDPDYHNDKTLRSLIQMRGRAMREGNDWCENFIFDIRASWFLHANKHLMPGNYKGRGNELIRMNEGVIPQPMRGL